MKIMLPVTLAAFAFGLAGPSHADIVFQDDFNRAETNSFVAGTGSWTNELGDFGNANPAIAFDTAERFSAGTANGVWHVLDSSSGSNVNEGINFESAPGTPVSLDVGTISFDYFEPAAADNWIRLNLNSNRRVELSNGATGGQVPAVSGESYALDAAVHFDILFNTTTTDETFEGFTIEARKVYVFADGTLIAQTTGSTLANSPIDSASFLTNFGGTGAEAFIDNLVVRDEFTIVPEPGSMVLSGMGIALLGFRRRQR